MSTCRHEVAYRAKPTRRLVFEDQDLSCFLEDVVKIVLENRLVSGMCRGKRKVVEFVHPKDLEVSREAVSFRFFPFLFRI